MSLVGCCCGPELSPEEPPTGATQTAQALSLNAQPVIVNVSPPDVDVRAHAVAAEAPTPAPVRKFSLWENLTLSADLSWQPPPCPTAKPTLPETVRVEIVQPPSPRPDSASESGIVPSLITAFATIIAALITVRFTKLSDSSAFKSGWERFGYAIGVWFLAALIIAAAAILIATIVVPLLFKIPSSIGLEIGGGSTGTEALQERIESLEEQLVEHSHPGADDQVDRLSDVLDSRLDGLGHELNQIDQSIRGLDASSATGSREHVLSLLLVLTLIFGTAAYLGVIHVLWITRGRSPTESGRYTHQGSHIDKMTKGQGLIWDHGYPYRYSLIRMTWRFREVSRTIAQRPAHSLFVICEIAVWILSVISVVTLTHPKQWDNYYPLLLFGLAWVWLLYFLSLWLTPANRDMR
ncbi:MAG: hypothetical protein AAF333_08925 [Planctomycetota bacterium]